MRSFCGVVWATVPTKVDALPYLDLVAPSQKWRKSSLVWAPSRRCFEARCIIALKVRLWLLFLIRVRSQLIDQAQDVVSVGRT